jgi:hypothetical protein
MAYSYYRSVTIDYTKCGTADSADFPVLVSFTDLNFRTVANGGRVQNASGYQHGSLDLKRRILWCDYCYLFY